MMKPLSPEDLFWIAERIHELRRLGREHSRWHRRIDWAIDNFLWSASVDGVDEEADVIRRDGWIASGGSISREHFERAPHTDSAWKAFEKGDLTSITREHVVPRAVLRKIVLQTKSPEDTQRVLRAYGLVAFVHDDECTRLAKQSMPHGWADGIDWSLPPDELPSPWDRYRKAKEGPIHVRYKDGRPSPF